tara:strand:- start:420 stop:569 length:150 start_codon:yes stop_codon:yes gene_type:complete
MKKRWFHDVDWYDVYQKALDIFYTVYNDPLVVIFMGVVVFDFFWDSCVG